MADRIGRNRLDSYGRPLPSLVEARQQYYGDKVSNQVQRERLLALLDEQWQVLLRRGIYGELVIQVHVEDGVIQDSSTIGTFRKIGLAKDGP